MSMAADSGGMNAGGSGEPRGGLVECVDRDSPARRAGIEPGDRVVALDGHVLHDVIDYQFYFDPVRQAVDIERDGRALKFELDNRGAPHPGITFTRALFDGVRRCRCNCVFCFVDQLPAGLRDTLYLKDDDYRLSFLYGNFITLNNLLPEDVERIAVQRLSPLYVSVHATEAAVRARLMGCSERLARAGLDNLRLLGTEGIEAHVQIVLCPGINDGAVLERTVMELARDYPAVGSVGVVPVAIGERRARPPGQGPSLRPPSREECGRLVSDVAGWQQAFRREDGRGFVFAADEFYLKAEAPLPDVASYDGFPQYENGVGIAAAFLDEAAGALREALTGLADAGRCWLLTGVLARPVVELALRRLKGAAPRWLEGRDLEPLEVTNNLFGPHVTVTGLLGGGDIIEAALRAGVQGGETILLPASALDSAGEHFLDGVTLEGLGAALGCAVMIV